jgi:HEAT repeat protein
VSDQIVSMLITTLVNDEPAKVRYAAADALSKLGPAARSAERALSSATHDEDPGLAAMAKRALNAIHNDQRP